MTPSSSTATVAPVASIEIEHPGDPSSRSRIVAGAEAGSVLVEDDEEILVEEVLVEEISIDGMCGVY